MTVSIRDEFYKLKLAALLHDPPHKPWLIREGRSHEEEAEELIRKVFSEGLVRYLDDPRVKLADKLASSLDRWVLSILMGEEYIHGLFPVKEIKLKNIVEPSVSTSLPEKYDKNKYEVFVRKLHNIAGETSDWKLRYHLMYLLYEVLWIGEGLSVGPADTRVPTHTVFDHNYATATMINWTYEKQSIKGLLVGLDVAGVQTFISSSRKLRDMWTSSYIVSALIWYTIVELVEKLGPDIVIMPSLRMNPFYLHWLKARFNAGIPEEIEKLIYLSREVHEMYKDLGIPPYPIIPGRATLILPPWHQVREIAEITYENCREYFKERFKEGWNLLWKVARKLAERRRDQDLIWRFIYRVFKYYEDTLFKKSDFDIKPPLELRIEYVSVNEDARREDLWRLYDEKYRELVRILGFARYHRKEPETELNLYELTREVFDKGISLGFPKPSEKGFDYCTMCGKLPAIVVLPARESEEPREDEFGFTIFCVCVRKEGGKEGLDPEEVHRIWKSRNDVERKRFEKLVEEFTKSLQEKFFLSQRRLYEELALLKEVFSPGEKLCPWCFLKRVISLEPKILDALLRGLKEDNLDKSIEEIAKSSGAELRFPSLARIASTRLYNKMLDKLDEIVPEIALGHYLPLKLTKEPKVIWVWPFSKEVWYRVKEQGNKLPKEERLLLYTVYSLDPEETWFHAERRSNWNKLLRKLDLAKWLWRYYALVKADADSIGDLLEGKITVFLAGKIGKDFYNRIRLSRARDEDIEKVRTFLRDYIENSCEDEFHKFISFCIKHISGELEEELARSIKKQYVETIAREGNIDRDEASRRINRVLEILRRLLREEVRVIISPSYHVAISSALMRAALLDVAIIAKLDGFTVYAGGDDLLAFVPVDRVLDVVYNTRRAYGGFVIEIELDKNIKTGEKAGFLRLRNAYLPMLPNVGRSYCIYIAHYRYPLSLVLRRATCLLEEAKDHYVFCYYDAETDLTKSAKDLLVIAYNPRAGTEEYTLLPISWKRPISKHASYQNIAITLSCVKMLLSYVDERLAKETGKFGLSEKHARIRHSLLYDFGERHAENIIYGLVCTSIREMNREEIVNVLKDLILSIIKRNIEYKYREEIAEKVFKCIFDPILSAKEPVGNGFFVKTEGHNDREGRICTKICEERGKEVCNVILSIINTVKFITSGMR